MSKDSVGVSRNAFTWSSLISSPWEVFFSWLIFSWKLSQILSSVLGGGRLFSLPPWLPYVVLYSSVVKKGWWSIQLSITVFIHWQVAISDPLRWTLCENLRTIAICVAAPEKSRGKNSKIQAHVLLRYISNISNIITWLYRIHICWEIRPIKIKGMKIDESSEKIVILFLLCNAHSNCGNYLWVVVESVEGWSSKHFRKRLSTFRYF